MRLIKTRIVLIYGSDGHSELQMLPFLSPTSSWQLCCFSQNHLERVER